MGLVTSRAFLLFDRRKKSLSFSEPLTLLPHQLLTEPISDEPQGIPTEKLSISPRGALARLAFLPTASAVFYIRNPPWAIFSP